MKNLASPEKIQQKILMCCHCDEFVFKAVYDEKSDPDHHKPFCCMGCLTVYQILSQKGLEDYYDIKNRTGIYRRRSPVEIQSLQYLFINDIAFMNEYSYLDANQYRTMEFYLEGIHCLGCLWLIEKFPSLVENVISAKLDLKKSIVKVTISKEGSFSTVAQEFNQLGYKPHPLKKNQDGEHLKTREERQFLLRIGIAAAGANNVMLYAISLYAGADGFFASIFNSLTVIFAIPVFSYCAFPFYKNAWQSLKNKNFSIDMPIAVSLLIGIAHGMFNYFTGIHENYFDSLTTLVFLLLLSRYFLKKIQENALSFQDLHFFYLGESLLRATDKTLLNFEEVHPKYITVNDCIKISSGNFIPADGKIIKGTTHVNTSLLTGESIPQEVGPHDSVFAGTQNISSEIIMQALKIKNETRLGMILNNVENGQKIKAPVVELTDKVSKYFILTVFGLALGLFCYHAFHGNLIHAVEQSLILLIVTCPCALALSVPLTFTRSLTKAAEHGIIIKSDIVLQKITKIKNIFLDKTGTITHGKLSVNSMCLPKNNTPIKKIFDVIVSLESDSKHPTAKALVEYATIKGGVKNEVTHHLEIPGVGVSGKINHQFYEINKHGVFENAEHIAKFNFIDDIRNDSKNTIQFLLSHNLKVHMLSGDNKSVVLDVAKKVNISPSQSYSELSPEEKNVLISKTPHSMMVGDGANDAIALANSHVGVAVLGAMDISLKAADVYLTTPGLSSVAKLITLSKETMKIIHRNLFLSLIYNSISVYLALRGWISPWAAAIIMPLSSLTVFLSSLYGTKKLRNLWK